MTSTEFKLENPADAARIWFMDLIHSPRALPPLSSHLNRVVSDVGPLGLEQRIVNGYVYSSPRSMTPPPPMPQLAPGEALKNWETNYLPATRRAYETFRDQPYASMSAREILSFIESQVLPAGVALANTIVSAMEIGPEAERLEVLLKAKVGADGDLLSATILHGGGSQTRSLGDDVQVLAESARQTPAVFAALTGRDFPAALASTAEPWAGALRAFLSEHEDEIALWSELHEPAWNEDPTPLLRLVVATLDSAANVRSDEGAAAADEVRARLAPEDLAEFEAALAISRNYVPVIEHRARWQLKLCGGVRKAVVALGQKLVDAGTLEAANDIFFLNFEELDPAIAGSLDAKPLVIARRAEWQEQLKLEPPIMLGVPVPYEMMGAVSPMLARMFGAVAIAARTENTVSGIGASKGVVRGRARVVGSLAEADEIQDGDILVCPSTSPPWSPYFSIVSAIVTNAGGMLSHAAIEAREYGIPAVVGTRDGTARIPDGSTIVVDGETGTITIER